jgi:OOP family OmpA-OmpF porin
MKKTLFCALALSAAPLLAADEVGKWYITPQAGYLWTDHDRAMDDDVLYGLAFGKHVSDQWSIEVNVNRSEPDASFGKMVFGAGSLDALRIFGRGNAVAPYVTFGAGWLNDDFDPGPTRDDFMAQAGLGLLWHLSDSFALRPEVKVRWDDTGLQGRQADYLGLLGFQFSFGAPKAPAAAPMPPPPPPAPMPEAAPTPPPPPAPPADTDGDGVLDPDDQCPGTRPGVAVDAVGCERKGSITLEGVTFELNSAELTADSKPALNRIAADLHKYARLKIELQGYTDSSGSDAYNLKLSQRRAEAVARYLIDAGTPAVQVTSRGYGEADPIASNTTAEGRAQNRRVVMKVLENPGEVAVQGEGKL